MFSREENVILSVCFLIQVLLWKHNVGFKNAVWRKYSLKENSQAHIVVITLFVSV